MSTEKKIHIEGADDPIEETAQQASANEQQAGEAAAADETTPNTDETAEPETAAGDATEPEKEEEKDPLAELQEQNAKLKDELLRRMAEFDNFRKRTQKEKSDLIFNGGEKAIKAILPVIDDFERALADKSDDPEVIRQGVQMIFNKLVSTLKGLGVKKIETEGQTFDTDFHEAIAMVPGMGDDKVGKVIDCVQTGYMLNDKVIRHAKVAVGQ